MDEQVISTEDGAVLGRPGEASWVWKGIPYAAPPVGRRRFLPPAPVEPWAGVRDARVTPAACPQPRMPRLFGKLDHSGPAFRETYDEDCLTLSVWTPSADGRRRPVMVWLHGGWFAIGSGNEPAYDGANLSAHGDVVVVTVNHRLGALGFLDVGSVDGGVAGSANAGLLDLVAALRWVRANISRFGGDPTNVTIFGESGGGCKVCALLATPAAAGLFHRAIVQSGPLLRAVEPGDARETARKLTATLGVSTMEELQALPVEAIVDAQVAVVGGPLGDTYGGGPRFAPVRDDRVIRSHPFDPVAAPGCADVPLLVGSCRDESTMLVLGSPGLAELPVEQQAALLNDTVLHHAFDALLGGYARTRPEGSPVDHMIAAATDQLRVGGIHIVERWIETRSAPAYMYRLDFASPAYGGRLGAMHAYDVGFVFRNTDCSAGITSLNRGLYEPGDAVETVTEAMARAWVAFARDGDPGHDGLPAWPAYELGRRATMVFDVDPRVADDPDSEERLLWDDRVAGM